MNGFAAPVRTAEDRPSSGEAPFHAGEVFYSRTDKRGIILSGNSVFHRVAHYDRSQLVGAPHKIIRHPDMPKAVFRLLWERIGRGEMIGAYVKNRASDRLFYWVFAVVAPTPDGYLSARIKPTTDLLRMVEGLYADVLRAETDEGLSPEESAAILVERVKSAGFESYNDFMTHALSEELLAEASALKARPDPAVANCRTMLASAKSLKSATETLVSQFEALRIIPHNMRVAASRLEPSGGPISMLSRNYGVMSQELSDWFSRFVLGRDSTFSVVFDHVRQALLLQSMVGILHRCDRQLQLEGRQAGEEALEDDRQILLGLSDRFAERAGSAISCVSDEAFRISTACDEMSRQLLGLSTARVTCKIENARLSDASGGLDDIISQLGLSQRQIGDLLAAIRARSAEISGFCLAYQAGRGSNPAPGYR